MKKFAALLTISALALSACASDIGSNQYTSSSVGSAGYADKCTVISVRQIQVRNEGNAGTLVGGLAGGAAGSQIGGGSTAHLLGAVGGAIVGGAAGHYAEKGLSSQSGFEYVVELDNGRILTTTQGSDTLLVPGDRCMVIAGGDRTRVIPYNGR